MDLKVHRIRSKVTQQQIATHLQLSRSWVAKVERVSDDLPRETVERYLAALRTFADVTEAA